MFRGTKYLGRAIDQFIEKESDGGGMRDGTEEEEDESNLFFLSMREREREKGRGLGDRGAANDVVAFINEIRGGGSSLLRVH